ncbi:type II toxin-antitoxin system RelE/ParE family toxin [Promicromonospora sp. NPDC057488]|uniref:type II toxin-antitoxin system RelE/ParE family toxin n=1 Tax=Promicromonospora sp. NPDC057488 TaxID=3346147 RepID=UPI00366FD275
MEFDEAVFEWLTGLEEESFVQVRAALNVLRDRGPQLGRPLVDTVVGSRHKNMKELRPGSAGRSELRVLFAFDPERSAILLVGGDKAGRWQDWYRSAIPMADDRYDAHLKALARRAGGDAGRGEER